VNTETNQPAHFDVYLTLYRSCRVLVVILITGLAVKYALVDTALIRTGHLSPSILKGDRVLLSRIQYAVPFRFIFHPRCGDPVLFMHPILKEKAGSLRIAGAPGNCIVISNGTFSNIDKPGLAFAQKRVEEVTLPPEYSPRDNMKPYRIPKPGDTVKIDTVPIRELLFFYSLIKQENPDREYSIKPVLCIDDSCTGEYFIKDFTLYSGALNRIPDSLYADWFFWDRLEAYCISKGGADKIRLTFSLHHGQTPLQQYVVKKKFYFLLSDAWCNGYDSRYFGPVIGSSIRGKIIGVLWSFAPDKAFFRGLRMRRICKII